MATDLNESALSGVFPVMEDTVGLASTQGVAAETFDAFFERHHGQLYGTLRLIADNAAEAEDLMQDAFLRVFERWDRVRAHPDADGYLYKTAFNLLKNRRRSLARAARRILDAPIDDDAYAAIDEREVVLDAMTALTVRQRAAVVLTDLLDYPSHEAARLLGVRAVTVRVLASQGRARLRERLETEDE